MVRWEEEGGAGYYYIYDFLCSFLVIMPRIEYWYHQHHYQKKDEEEENKNSSSNANSLFAGIFMHFITAYRHYSFLPIYRHIYMYGCIEGLLLLFRPINYSFFCLSLSFPSHLAARAFRRSPAALISCHPRGWAAAAELTSVEWVRKEKLERPAKKRESLYTYFNADCILIELR